MSELGLPDLLSLVQTIAIIVALLITLYFSRRQLQALGADLESRVLNDLNEKFNRMGEMFIERPELLRTVYQAPKAPGPELPAAYSVMIFCAHAFHMRRRGILQDNEWSGLLQWMRNAFRYGTIRQGWVEDRMAEWFDPAFAQFVEKELLPGSTGASPGV